MGASSTLYQYLGVASSGPCNFLDSWRKAVHPYIPIAGSRSGHIVLLQCLGVDTYSYISLQEWTHSPPVVSNSGPLQM